MKFAQMIIQQIIKTKIIILTLVSALERIVEA